MTSINVYHTISIRDNTYHKFTFYFLFQSLNSHILKYNLICTYNTCYSAAVISLLSLWSPSIAADVALGTRIVVLEPTISQVEHSGEQMTK